MKFSSAVAAYKWAWRIVTDHRAGKAQRYEFMDGGRDFQYNLLEAIDILSYAKPYDRPEGTFYDWLMPPATQVTQRLSEHQEAKLDAAFAKFECDLCLSGKPYIDRCRGGCRRYPVRK